MDFFSKSSGEIIYERYGILHIEMIISFLIILALIFLLRNKLKMLKFKDKPIRYLIAIILFGNMTLYYLLEIINGTWTYKLHIPLHICFIANYFFIYVLLTNNRKNRFNIAYYLTFIGPLPYIIFPEMNIGGKLMLVGFDRYMWWQAYISHYFLIICSVYCLFVLNWKVEKKGIWKTFIISNIIFILVYLFNIIFGTNYIMTDKLPDFVIKIFPFVKAIDFPMIWLEIAGSIALFVAYIPVMINKKYKNE